MLTKEEMREIQDLKLRGYTQTEIHDYFVEQGRKPPSRPTIAKYFRMDVIPENPGEKLAKDKAFDEEPFRSAINAAVEANAGRDFCMSSVYDLLEEKFVDSGEYDGLPGNEQTLRNYVHHLTESGQINASEEHLRVYDHIFDTPPGEQMLIDFGEEAIDKKRSVHFMCLWHPQVYVSRSGRKVLVVMAGSVALPLLVASVALGIHQTISFSIK